MSIPTIEDNNNFIETVTCSICHDDIVANSPIWILIGCNHRYHKGCIQPWANRQLTCPICRRPFIRPGPDNIAHIRQTIAFAFTIKIVNTLLISDYANELPTIRSIIANYRPQMNSAAIDTTNLQTFYESFLSLRKEMTKIYGYSDETTVQRIIYIQNVVRKIIHYQPMFNLIVRCTRLPPQ